MHCGPVCVDCRRLDIASGIPGRSPALSLALSGFRDGHKWRGRATASLGSKTHQRWLHPCLVSKLTAPAPSTLIPSEPVNRFLKAPLAMAAPLFLPQMEAPEMAPASWLGWLDKPQHLSYPTAQPLPRPCWSAAMSQCGLHFTKRTCCVV